MGNTVQDIMKDIYITIPSDFVFERVVRESAVVVAKHIGFSEDRVADLQLAVSEAVTNAIEHGNKLDSNVKVGVRFLINDERLAVEVSDQGRWSGVLKQVDHFSLDDKLDEDEPRGMGIFLIQQLVDDVRLISNEDGTQFTMWFNIAPPDSVLNTIDMQAAEHN